MRNPASILLLFRLSPRSVGETELETERPGSRSSWAETELDKSMLKELTEANVSPGSFSESEFPQSDSLVPRGHSVRISKCPWTTHDERETCRLSLYGRLFPHYRVGRRDRLKEESNA